MPILKRLAVTHLRNLHSVSVGLSETLNIFYGDNGSGKTSVLESIALLGLGRSFRSHKTRSLITHEEASLAVFSEIQDDDISTAVGIQKYRDGKTQIRMAGEPIYSAATLAKQLPLQVINANSFQLIEGSPTQRRQFLDWLVFHVKPEFSSLWKDLQKALKQRNSLLRHDKIDYLQLHPWDIEFCRLANEVDKLRAEVFHGFREQFLPLYQELPYETTQSVSLEYNRGWDSELELREVLEQSFERDKRDGYSHYGPQRADIKIKVAGKAAVDILSRGQEKALICALHIAQASSYRAITGKVCVFLIDDLKAELDDSHSQQLAKWLTSLQAQVFVTGVSCDELCKSWEKEDINMAVFHVKQGNIEKLTKN